MIDHFDSQAFAATLSHQHGLELAALYTLQYRLSRNAESDGGLQHGQIFRRRLLHDARAQFIGDSNLPRRARRDLLTGDESICQPAMNAGSIHAQNLRRFADRNQFSGRWLSRRLEASNVAIPPQAADMVGGEAFSGGRFAILAIQDSSDHFIGIEICQAAKQRDRIFVGARPYGPELRYGDIQRSNRSAAPAECQMSASFGPFEIQNHFFQ